jgi:hypothetical protein
VTVFPPAPAVAVEAPVAPAATPFVESATAVAVPGLPGVAVAVAVATAGGAVAAAAGSAVAVAAGSDVGSAAAAPPAPASSLCAAATASATASSTMLLLEAAVGAVPAPPAPAEDGQQGHAHTRARAGVSTHGGLSVREWQCVGCVTAGLLTHQASFHRLLGVWLHHRMRGTATGGVPRWRRQLQGSSRGRDSSGVAVDQQTHLMLLKRGRRGLRLTF